VLTLLGQSSGTPSCQVTDGLAKVGGWSRPHFSDSSDRFQTGKIVVMCGGPSGLRARTVHVCAECVLFAHNGWI
jgi:hypothetical protein